MRRQATRADGQHVLTFSRDSLTKVLPAAERWRREADLLSLSTKARLRLEWIIFYRTIAERSARKTARYFGISPQTVCEWVDRFGDRDLRGLEDESSAPKRRWSWQPDPLVLERMLALRREYPEWGKETLAAVYRERYGEAMSSWQFQRMISLFRLARRRRKQHHGQRGMSPKQRITYAARREAKELWQLDTVVVRVDGQSRYVLTGLEHATKLGYAFAYERATSRAARDFLERLRYLMGSRIGVILTDNGSEFAGRFEMACREAEVTRFYSRPRRPTDNPECERFNQTLQREWLDQQNATPDLTMLNFSLERWLETYNGVRPHHALGLKTPLQVADELGVLSRTSPSATGALYSKSLAPNTRQRCRNTYKEETVKVEHLGGPKTPGNDCPAVYSTDRGTYLIQGYRVPKEYLDKVQNLSENEDVIEIPRHLVQVVKGLAE